MVLSDYQPITDGRLTRPKSDFVSPFGLRPPFPNAIHEVKAQLGGGNDALFRAFRAAICACFHTFGGGGTRVPTTARGLSSLYRAIISLLAGALEPIAGRCYDGD